MGGLTRCFVFLFAPRSQHYVFRRNKKANNFAPPFVKISAGPSTKILVDRSTVRWETWGTHRFACPTTNDRSPRISNFGWYWTVVRVASVDTSNSKHGNLDVNSLCKGIHASDTLLKLCDGWRLWAAAVAVCATTTRFGRKTET